MNKKVFKPQILIMGIVILAISIALWLFGITSPHDSVTTSYDKAMLRAFSGSLLMLGSTVLLVRLLLQIKLQKEIHQGKNQCNTCGEIVQEKDKFCQSCGTQL